ncbi:MAG: hypothetical protein SPI65_06695 [Peptoniphilus sp.]|nr:hypothetical protein [Peptoniphilus sp.]MDY6045243.1 hypothetical protein [Peptoniphilus sp.]
MFKMVKRYYKKYSIKEGNVRSRSDVTINMHEVSYLDRATKTAPIYINLGSPGYKYVAREVDTDRKNFSRLVGLGYKYWVSESAYSYKPRISFDTYAYGDYYFELKSINSDETSGIFDVYRRGEIQGSYIGEVTAEDGTYPANGKHTDGYWYVRGDIANQAPTISGNNLDLGSKLENFDVDYIVNDPDTGDSLTVDILVDGVKKVSAKSVVAGIKNTYSVDLSEFTLGDHTVQIIASDGQTQSEPRVYTFYKSNSAPLISGTDRDIGGKSTPFTETFTVSDRNKDPVSVIVTLNGDEIKSISNAEGQTQSFTVTQDMLNQLEIGSINTIVIRADDGKGGISYRRLTFTRDNRAPIISGTDSDLGEKTEAFNLEYEITDLERDAISSEIYLNGLLLEENEEVEDGVNNTFQLPHKIFIELPTGQHTIKIVATDSQGGTSERIHTFTKVIENIEFYLQIQKTDVRVEKILAIFNKFIAEGDTMTLKASNNFSDENPTWEDITDNSEKKLAYLFENETKTAETWDLGLWCNVVKGDSGVESVFRGVSGGFE